MDQEQATENLAFLSRLRIRCLVNLCTEGERTTSGTLLLSYCKQLPEFMVHKRLPLTDRSTPRREQVSQILDYIDASLAHKLPTYLHCRGGKYRTGTIVACYLIRHGLAEASEAVEMNGKLREAYDAAACNLSSTQTDLILSWKRGD